MISSETRDAVRATFNYQCGYCGVSEILTGSKLEVEHFQPVSQGGTDVLENLVYACTTCNRFKSNYWPPVNAPEDLHLLHPRQDDLQKHILQMPDGHLAGLTSRGWFHINWLHLNRPQLVALRVLQKSQLEMTKTLTQSEEIAERLLDRISQLEKEVKHLQSVITYLMQG